MKGIKTGGREVGTPNKVSAQLRGMISDFLTENFETIQQDFKELKPKDKAKIYCDLLQYGLPKLQSVSMEVELNELNKPVIIDWSGISDETLKELSELKEGYTLSEFFQTLSPNALKELSENFHIGIVNKNRNEVEII